MARAARRVAPLLSWAHDAPHMIGMELWARRALGGPAQPSEEDFMFATSATRACARVVTAARRVADARAASWDVIMAKATMHQEMLARASVASEVVRPVLAELSAAMAEVSLLQKALQVQTECSKV